MINDILYKLNQFYLEKKYQKARKIYIVCLWARYGVLEARWSGKFNEDGHPLTIHWDDHNGERETYTIVPFYRESTGSTIYYSFTKESAKKLAERFNGQLKERINNAVSNNT
jgi:hypothetical protein